MSAALAGSASRRPVVLAILLLLALGVLVSELLVRLALPYNSVETFREFSLAYDRAVYARSRLHPAGRLVEVDGEKAWGTKERSAASAHRYYINDLGFRGPAFAPRKPAGTTRVFVLGGSAVFDQNVSDDSAAVGNSWPDRAQTLLRERGFNVEVINAGTPAHSSIDALGRLLSEIWYYDPDIVLLYSGWNDIKNFRGAEVTPEAPLARVIRPSEPAADPFRNYAGAWDRLLSRSQLYAKFRNQYLGRQLAVGGEGILPEGTISSSYGPFGPRQYELDLRSFVDIARNIGARPALSTQATLILNPDPSFDARIGYDYQLLDRAGLRRAFEDVYRISRQVAQDKAVPILDAGPPLNADAANLADHVHLSPSGSEAMAHLLADFLAPMLPPR